MPYYLSTTRGNPIAIYKNDDQRKLIRLSEEKDTETPITSITDYIPHKDLEIITREMTTRDLINIERSIELKQRPVDSKLAPVYDIIKRLVDDKKDKEIKTVEGDYLIYPKRDDILYLIGATGSGKSTSIRRYLIEYKKIFPEVKNIFLFTDNEKPDEVLEGLGITRIKLNENIWKKPIKPHELSESVVIFDDVDSIQDRKILKAITELKGSCMKQGVSKCGITCIVTNHDACEGLVTKSTITNARYIFVYPLGGTSNLEYLFKKKIGIGKMEYKKIASLGSRVVIFHKRAPFYVVHSHGVFLLQ